MPNSIESMQHNAAFAPQRGYFNVPLVGALSLNASGNIAMGDIIFPYDGAMVSLFDTNITANQALSGLNDVNRFGMDNSIGIIGFGKYCKDKKSFWSFDMNLKTSSNFSAPYEMFEFFKTAPAYSSIQDVNFHLESYIETAFGYSREIDNRLTVGARVKFLTGIASADFNIDRMDVTLTSDEWIADASGSLELNANGMSAETSVDEYGVESFELGDIGGSIEGAAGYGAAIDLGATYNINDRLQVSLAVNDIGFILWGKESNTRASVANSFYFTGATYDVNTEESTGGDGIEFSDIALEEQQSRASMNWLQSSINAGGEYKFLDNRLGVGLIYAIDFWKTSTVHNITAAASFTPINCFTFATSYAMTSNKSNAFGFAANFATGFMNIFVATDILASKKSAQFIPINQSTMSISFGLAVPFGAKGERKL